MFAHAATSDPLMQGDLINDCPLVSFNLTSGPIDWNDPPTKWWPARVIILTQACDLARGNDGPVLVAMVQDAKKLVADGMLKASATLPRHSMSDNPSREEIHDAVNRAVRELLDEVGLHDPPVDVARIIHHLGLLPDAGPKRGRARIVAKIEESASSTAWLEAHAFGLHLRPDFLDPPSRTNQEGDPMDPQIFSAHELFLTPHAIGLHHLFLLIR